MLAPLITLFACVVVAPPSLHADNPSAPSGVFDPRQHARDTAAAAEFIAPGMLPTGSVRAETVIITVESLGNTQQAELRANPGDVIRVRALRGRWTVDQRTIKPVGAAGHVAETALHRDWGQRREVSTLPFGRLLLRVGAGPWLDALGGDGVRTRVGGPVALAINDNAASLADNAGSLEVEITLERRGAPTVTTVPPPSRPPPVNAPAPPSSQACEDSRCAPNERCVLHQVMCATAPCPPLPTCVPR